MWGLRKEKSHPLPLLFAEDHERLWGHLRQMKDPLAFFGRVFKRCRQDDIPFMALDLAKRVYFTAGQEPAREILTNSKEFVRTDIARQLVGDAIGPSGLVLADGEAWRPIHKVVRDAFRRIDELTPEVDQAVQSMMERWRPQLGQPLPLGESMAELTLHVLFRTIFEQVGRANEASIARAFTRLMAHLYDANTAASILARVPYSRSWRDGRDAKRELQSVLDEVVAFHENSTVAGARYRLLPELISASRRSEAPLTILQLRETVLALLFAGHETTANVLAAAFQFLEEDADLRERLAALAQDLPRDHVLTADDLRTHPALQLAEKVFTMALILRPPVYMMGRQSVGQVQLCGYTFPPGTNFLVPMYLLLWESFFQRRLQTFDPEGYCTRGRKSLEHLYTFLHGSPHYCLGADLAYMEGKIALARILQHYHVRVGSSDGRTEPHGAFMLRVSSSLYLVLTPRR